MVDAVLLVLGGMLFGGGLVGLFRNLCQLVHLLRHRGQINRRLAQVKRDLKAWKCWKCGKYFDSEERPRPLCLCNACLIEYKEKVA